MIRARRDRSKVIAICIFSQHICERNLYPASYSHLVYLRSMNSTSPKLRQAVSVLRRTPLSPSPRSRQTFTATLVANSRFIHATPSRLSHENPLVSQWSPELTARSSYLQFSYVNRVSLGEKQTRHQRCLVVAGLRKRPRSQG